MPRYFFHVRNGKDLPDTEGSELPDLNAARTEAIKASGEMLRDNKGGADFWSGHDWTMTVVDDKGGTILTLRFAGTMHA